MMCITIIKRIAREKGVEFMKVVFPIMGLTLYLMVGLNGGTSKMRKRYKDIDERLLPLLPENHKIQEKLQHTIPKAGNIS